MGACLLLFMGVSAALNWSLSTRNVRERVFNEELPAVVSSVRGDIQRQIAAPLAMSLGVANNTFLLDWEAAGEPESGLGAWKRYANQLKNKLQAGEVFWVSETSRNYFTESGVSRQVSATDPKDSWFSGFLASNKPYTLDIGHSEANGGYMLFINVRFDAGQGKRGLAGLGLPVTALADSLKAIKLHDSGFVYLVRADGQLLVHRDTALVDGTHTMKDLPGFDAAIVPTLLSQKPYAYATYNAAGGTHVVASSYIPELNMYVIAEVPESEVLAGVTRTAALASLVSGVIGGALAIVVIFLVSRAIAAPVGRAAKLLGDIADGDGDLTRRMEVESHDEVGQLAGAFNRFVASLEHMITQVRHTAESISVASSQVATGSQDLSQRTEQTASALQQTASSMEELTSTVQSNAESAQQASGLANAAGNVANEGGQAMTQIVNTMQEINASSRKIAEIIGVIDGIAFQTNILALNAAVEAARAGEQGRGFAVVAGEVRALAQRSTQASKEIRTLITSSVAEVEGGSTLVSRAGSTMQELVTSVNQLTQIIHGIDTATGEQSRGLVEINQSITHLDGMTQQNAALVEQSTAAAESMRTQAQQLLQAVGAFKLSQAGFPATGAGSGHVKRG
ncbi:MAG: methyl-accepting chemotaxis protein [Aquabacterium sp.]